MITIKLPGHNKLYLKRNIYTLREDKFMHSKQTHNKGKKTWSSPDNAAKKFSTTATAFLKITTKSKVKK